MLNAIAPHAEGFLRLGHTAHSSFWYGLAGDFWAGQGVPQCTGTACAHYPWGLRFKQLWRGEQSLLHGPELDAEGWNIILAPQWDYTPSHHICGSGLGFCKAGSSAWQVWPRNSCAKLLPCQDMLALLCCSWECQGAAVQTGKLLWSSGSHLECRIC